jgi:hypothetical protein
MRKTYVLIDGIYIICRNAMEENVVVGAGGRTLGKQIPESGSLEMSFANWVANRCGI